MPAQTAVLCVCTIIIIFLFELVIVLEFVLVLAFASLLVIVIMLLCLSLCLPGSFAFAFAWWTCKSKPYSGQFNHNANDLTLHSFSKAIYVWFVRNYGYAWSIYMYILFFIFYIYVYIYIFFFTRYFQTKKRQQILHFCRWLGTRGIPLLVCSICVIYLLAMVITYFVKM